MLKKIFHREGDIKAIKEMEKGMVMAPFTLKTEVILRENGRMIKCMDLVSFITKMEQ